MMRTTVKIDSATPEQVYDLTLAFQRTLGFPLPPQITNRPTVTVGGSAMGWESPALFPEHAVSLLAEYHDLQALRDLAARVRVPS
jgi:hypothetical protein